MKTIQSTPAAWPVKPANRWFQLALGVACLVAAANAQYAWTLFVPEIEATYGWSRAAIQTAFTIFVITQTWLAPLEGYFIDKFGPRAIVFVGGALTGIAWVVDSYATSLAGFYFGAVLSGIGVGCVYSTCINNALKWFPDRRGLAVGLTAGGYGSGTILTILPISHMISTTGFQSAFFTFGLIQGAIIMVCSLFLSPPVKTVKPVYSTKLVQSRRDYTLGEALRTPVFWLMMLMFTMTVTGGLMAVAQLSVMAKDLGVKEMPVNMYFFTMAALPFALMLDRLMNGFSRPFFGWISDNIGRERTMFVAFTLEGLGILALANFGGHPVAFVLLSGVVFLAWGEVYSLFSATAGDTFGTKNIGKIYGLLYCSKGVAALLVPFGNVLMEMTGTWATVLYTMAAMDICAAILAIAVLRPLIARHHRLDANNANDPTAVRATAARSHRQAA
ncbi:oxalate/formate MFS antiporter [Tepidamorphus sp. 3E244]|uniref:oxalate/formate MFS antiporter n=1 Tax=Tepidamorphus sp. 3E244 TaxID=3385498 RepID=UPI0038FD283F